MSRVTSAKVLDEDVNMSELLDAMADSLVGVKFVAKGADVADKPPAAPVIMAKPPREVFYRESLRFAPKAPLPVLRQQCTCRYLCNGAKATLKCLSCALYDPSGVSYYCNACFDSRHPWYRITHIFTQIHQDELVGINMKIQREQIELERYTFEGT